MSFKEALARNPAPPRKLGDVQLTYDPPLLVGKGASRATLAPSAALVAGTALGLTTLVAFFYRAGEATLVALVLATGAAFMANVMLERRAVRHRSFVCHFAEKTLRIDTATAFNTPRMLIADFEKVSAVEIVTALDGMLALTVTFVPATGKPVETREALIAFVFPMQRPELERIATLLRNAFAPAPKDAFPAAEPEPTPADPSEPVDTFTP